MTTFLILIYFSTFGQKEKKTTQSVYVRNDTKGPSLCCVDAVCYLKCPFHACFTILTKIYVSICTIHVSIIGPAGKLKLPIEAHCTSDNEQHSPTDDSHTQQLVISNQGNQTSMV